MSDNRITVGVIAQLVTPVGDYNEDLHQELAERLEYSGSPLRLNHDGDIIIFVDEDGESYNTGLVIFDDSIMERFENELTRAKLFVYTGTPKFFFDHWYDGCDSNHSGITLAQAGYEEN